MAGARTRTRSSRPSPPHFPPLARNLALELAPIRVNVIAAGFVDTPLSATLLGDQLDVRREQPRSTLPIGRVVGPADVAALALNLMTNTVVTGATFGHRQRAAAPRVMRRQEGGGVVETSDCHASRGMSGEHSRPQRGKVGRA